MSPTTQMASSATYTVASDAMDRHEYGITKRYLHHQYPQHAQHHQSQQHHTTTVSSGASTGGGRAWSDDEEVYLLQTRLQKMPYKHIAAHLRKTELACRLHYHQLSHGSNRRKRAASVSSGSSTPRGQTGSRSPSAQAAAPAQVHEHAYPHALAQARTPSPPATSYSMSSGGVQLPAIMSSMSTSSPRLLPTILPKPNVASMSPSTSYGPPGSAPSPPSSSSSSSSLSLPAQATPNPHGAPLLPAATFTSSTASAPASDYSDDTDRSEHVPSLRLDCNSLPAAAGTNHPVDMGRLHAVYAVHRTSFWSAIASEYGHGANPAVLEQAWRAGFGGGSAPLTPSTSHDDRDFYGVKGAPSQDKTRISAILGIDANPRSPKERELVRRLEEERVVVPPVA